MINNINIYPGGFFVQHEIVKTNSYSPIYFG